MKTLKTTAIVLGLFALLVGTTSNVKAQDDYYQGNNNNGNNVSLQTFYDELSPYGTWIQDPQYGYVWRPDVDQSDFRPYYSNGRWAMTEYGNTWVSNYDWGWAPFHYGRWVYNRYREWIWLPDTNWGPAWVDWRSGGGYYGWAPMAPTIHINLSFGRRYITPDFCWNFIPQRNIYYSSYPRYDYGRNNVYINNTTIINNTYIYNKRSYYGGPRAEDIRRATNRDVTVYRFDQGSRPGASRIDNRSVSIYRPRPDRNSVDNRSAAPKKFEERSAGYDRNSRSGNQTVNRDGRTDNNRVSQTDNRNNQNDNTPKTRGGSYDRNNQGVANGGAGDQRARADRGSVDQGNQQRDAQVQQQRTQQDQQQRVQRDAQVQQQRTQQDQQQRAQRDAQVQQQRTQQDQQQRAQRDAQVQQQRTQQDQQQRAQRDAQVQQQRTQQDQQQRAQQDAQVQQQRAQQDQQQRAQRDAQVQQQRAQQQPQQQQRVQPQRQEQNNSGGESGRPSRGGRG